MFNIRFGLVMGRVISGVRVKVGCSHFGCQFGYGFGLFGSGFGSVLPGLIMLKISTNCFVGKWNLIIGNVTWSTKCTMHTSTTVSPTVHLIGGLEVPWPILILDEFFPPLFPLLLLFHDPYCCITDNAYLKRRE